MLGFAAGVMIAASYWSLLEPAIALGEEGRFPGWVPAAIGFMLGGIFLRFIDAILPHLHLGLPTKEAEGISTTWKRTTLLVLAVTIQYTGRFGRWVAFGAVAAGMPTATISGAIALAIGIGIQNFPEGMAISMPLRGERMSAKKSFGMVNCRYCGTNIFCYRSCDSINCPLYSPYALAFAAGAMIFVVVRS